MADDEVFEVTAISEQLDLRTKYAQIKKCSAIQDQRGEYAFDGLQLMLLVSYIEVGRLLLALF